MENKIEKKEIKLNNERIGSNNDLQVKTIVIDLGNTQTKVTDGVREEVYASIYSKDTEKFKEKLKYVCINDEYTYFQKGDYSLTYDKTKKDFTSSIAYAIAKITEDVDILNVNLVLLLPIDQMKNQGELIEALQGKELQYTARINKTTEKLVVINKVVVCPEGMSSWWTCSQEEKKNFVMLVDIGGRTTNIIGMKAGETSILDTFDIGMLNLFERLKNRSGKNYPLADIEHHIQNGDITLLKKNKAEFLMEIIDQMNVKRYFLDNFDSVIFTGGGSAFLGEIIKTKLPQNCRLHENPIKSNMLGAMLLGKQILGTN